MTGPMTRCPDCGAPPGAPCTAAIAGDDTGARIALASPHPRRLWRAACRLPDSIELVALTPDCWMLYAPGRRFLGRLERLTLSQGWVPFGPDGRALPVPASARGDLAQSTVLIFAANIESARSAS